MEQLLSTKFFIPSVRSELVTRSRLIDRLNEGIHRKLTLISAPAGFGKTTLVADFLQGLDTISKSIAVGWVSLDENDNDPVRFLTYFIESLCRAKGLGSKIGEGALGMLQSPQPPPGEAVLTSLINDVAGITGRLFLILDDYHLISAKPVHEAISFLLENMPPQMHLILVTREDPLLPLPRFRARNQITELRATDLRFTPSEAADFLNQVMGLGLSTDEITALEARTEGWIAGLQLAAISLQGNVDTSKLIQSFTGSNRLVLDYLIEEVLHQQPNNIQNFLLKTSILDRMTGSLCDVLTGSENGQETLELLERANLFIIPLDEERQWYRYHHLFGDLLRQRLDRSSSGSLSKLNTEASEWYEQNGYADEAIKHALRADNFDRAVNIIDSRIDDIWGAGQHSTIQRWLSRLPNDLVISKSHLCIVHAWYSFVNGQQQLADEALLAAEQVIDSDVSIVTDTEKRKLHGRIAAIKAFIANYRGDIPGMVQQATQALEYLPPEELTWRCLSIWALGDAYLFKGEIAKAYQARLEALEISQETGHYYLILVSYLRLDETIKYQGKLDKVAELCKQQMKFVEESGISRTVAAGWLWAVWADVLAEKNELDEAYDKVTMGVKLAGDGGRDMSFFGWTNLYYLNIISLRGELSNAEKVIEKLQAIFREYDLPILAVNQLSAWQAKTLLKQDKLDKAIRWVEDRKLTTDGELSFFRETEHIVFARILISQEKLDEAATLLQRLLEYAQMGGRITREIEILILQAIVHQAKDENEKAMSVLEQALVLAEPEGFIRTFVDEGSAVARLLYEALSLEIKPDYVQQLLSVFPNIEAEPVKQNIQQTPEGEWVEPLSERELEVLQLIAKGLTNREVGERLYLTPNTVKAHARTIYGKLGVNNRTQAVSRARALGLISDS